MLQVDEMLGDFNRMNKRQVSTEIGAAFDFFFSALTNLRIAFLVALSGA